MSCDIWWHPLEEAQTRKESKLAIIVSLNLSTKLRTSLLSCLKNPQHFLSFPSPGVVGDSFTSFWWEEPAERSMTRGNVIYWFENRLWNQIVCIVLFTVLYFKSSSTICWFLFCVSSSFLGIVRVPNSGGCMESMCLYRKSLRKIVPCVWHKSLPLLCLLTQGRLGKDAKSRSSTREHAFLQMKPILRSGSLFEICPGPSSIAGALGFTV